MNAAIAMFLFLDVLALGMYVFVRVMEKKIQREESQKENQ